MSLDHIAAGRERHHEVHERREVDEGILELDLERVRVHSANPDLRRVLELACVPRAGVRHGKQKVGEGILERMCGSGQIRNLQVDRCERAIPRYLDVVAVAPPASPQENWAKGDCPSDPLEGANKATMPGAATIVVN